MIVRLPEWHQKLEREPDGLVRVTDLDSGEVGYFDRAGRPVRGELTWADPGLLAWLAAPGPEAGTTPRESSSSQGERDPS